MTGLNFNPRIVVVAAATIKPGHIIVESHGHTAQVTRVERSGNAQVTLFARYIWQASSEPEWELGTFDPKARIEKAVR